MCGNDNDRVNVIVDMERYAELIRAEEHYTNIVNAAIDNMSLSTWRSGGFDIDMDDIKQYIMVAEADAISYRKKLLEAREMAKESAAVTVTVKEDEI